MILSAQNYINKIVPSNSKQPPGASNLIYYKDKLLLSYGYVSEDSDFDREKSAIIILDTATYEKVNEMTYDSIDIGYEGIIKTNNDRLYLLGNSNTPIAQKFIRISELGVSYEPKWLKSFESKYFPAFPLRLMTIKNSIYLLSQENFKIILYKFDQDGSLKFNKDFLISDLNRNSPDQIVNISNNNIIISASVSFKSKLGSYGQLIKIDTLGNVIWNYVSDKESRSGASPFFATELSNGNIVQVTEIDRFDATNQYWEYPPLLRWVSQDGKFIKDTVILTKPRLKQARINGINKGRGDYFFLRGNFYTVDGGWAWILKINNDGKILWSHTYRHPEFRTKFAYYYLADMIEEENGDLTVYGSLDDYSTNPLSTKLWLFRVNKDGCYGSEACSEEEVLYTAVNEVDTRKDKITIYPNPTNDKIEISFDENKSGSCSIFDVHCKNAIGINFNAQQKIEVDVSNLNKGTYFVKMRDEKSGQVTVKVFVKI